MNPFVKLYLSGYNLIAFLLWLAYLILFASAGFELDQPGILLLVLAQGMAALEIVHAALRWVKSPLGSTAAQVGSRLLVLALIFLFHQHDNLLVIFGYGVKIVSFAWGITELVRYSFYLLSLRNIYPKSLLWMRYSFFIVLYPLGVTGEWFILIACGLVLGLAVNLHTAALVGLFLSYAYYFPVLYKYMWRQRRSKL